MNAHKEKQIKPKQQKQVRTYRTTQHNTQAMKNANQNKKANPNK